MEEKKTRIVAAWINSGDIRPFSIAIVGGENPRQARGVNRMLIATSGVAAVNESKPLRSIMAVKEEFLTKLGISVDTLSTDAKNPTLLDIDADEAFGFQVTNQVTETVEPREGSTQEPKINPSTGNAITHKGKPVYRYVDLVPVEDCQHTLLTADAV